MEPILKAALGQPARTFTAVRLELPDGDTTYVARLLNGGQVNLGGEAYIGEDGRLGVLDSVSTLSDGMDSQASAADLIILPRDDDAIALLAHPMTQGAPVTIWQGAIDTDTGAAFGVEMLFTGEINYAVLVVGEQERAIRLELLTAEARALEPNDDRRLSHACHAAIWPGEWGLMHVTGVTQKDFWRVRKPSITYVGGGVGVGGAGPSTGGGGQVNDVGRPMVMD